MDDIRGVSASVRRGLLWDDASFQSFFDGQREEIAVLVLCALKIGFRAFFLARR